eukprot:11610967-Alexandrium_andersonii.AAC.1
MPGSGAWRGAVSGGARPRARLQKPSRQLCARARRARAGHWRPGSGARHGDSTREFGLGGSVGRRTRWRSTGAPGRSAREPRKGAPLGSPAWELDMAARRWSSERPASSAWELGP